MDFAEGDGGVEVVEDAVADDEIEAGVGEVELVGVHGAEIAAGFVESGRLGALAEVVHIDFGDVDGGDFRAVSGLLHAHLAAPAAVVEDGLAAEVGGEAVDGGVEALLGGVGREVGEFAFQPDALGEYIACGVGFVFAGDAFGEGGGHGCGG